MNSFLLNIPNDKLKCLPNILIYMTEIGKRATKRQSVGTLRFIIMQIF